MKTQPVKRARHAGATGQRSNKEHVQQSLRAQRAKRATVKRATVALPTLADAERHVAGAIVLAILAARRTSGVLSLSGMPFQALLISGSVLARVVRETFTAGPLKGCRLSVLDVLHILADHGVLIGEPDLPGPRQCIAISLAGVATLAGAPVAAPKRGARHAR